MATDFNFSLPPRRKNSLPFACRGMSAATGGAGTGTGTVAKGGPATFVIMGHGEETLIPFESRSTLPDGYTLVTVALCGALTDYDVVIPFVSQFVDPSMKRKLQKASPGGDIDYHVYHAGDKIPALTAQLYIPMEKTASSFEFLKSGVYQMGTTTLEDWELTPEHPSPTEPFFQERWIRTIPLDTIRQTTGLIKHTRSNLVSKKNALDLIVPTYEKSLMPTMQEVRKTIEDQEEEHIRYDDLVKNPLWKSVPLEQILAHCGKGVYYWPVCRGIKNQYQIHNYISHLKHMDPTASTRYNPYIYTNFSMNKEKIKEIENLMGKNVETFQKENDVLEEYVARVKSTLGPTRKNVHSIRRASQEQQARIQSRKKKGSAGSASSTNSKKSGSKKKGSGAARRTRRAR